MIRKYAFDTTLKIIPHLFCVCVSIANTYEAIAIPVLFMVWFGVLNAAAAAAVERLNINVYFLFLFLPLCPSFNVYFEVFAFFS